MTGGLLHPGGGGGGVGAGYTEFKVTVIIEWGHQNLPKSLGLQTNPQKIPGPKFNPQKSEPEKFIRTTTQLGYVGIITNLQVVLNTPENPYT